MTVKEIECCSSCYSKDITLLKNFGQVNLAGYFPRIEEVDFKLAFEMKLLICEVCQLVQISPDIDDKHLFEEYRYASRFSMQKHLSELANWISQELLLDKESKILEIGCNDGTLLNELRDTGFEPIGIDPARNIVAHAVDNEHRIVNDYFSPEIVKRQSWEKKFDLIISTNSFAHISEISRIAEGISEALDDKGLFLVEVQSWPELVRTGAFDFVYHEHKYYYDLNSISNLFARFDMTIFKVKNIPVHGGSYRIVFTKDTAARARQQREMIRFRDREVTRNEVQDGIRFFFEQIERLNHSLRKKTESGKKIVGFGASGRANMLAAYGHLGDYLETVYDESPQRIGRKLGLSGIDILAFEQLRPNDYDECLVLAWNFFDDILRKWPHKKTLIKPLPLYTEKNP